LEKNKTKFWIKIAKLQSSPLMGGVLLQGACSWQIWEAYLPKKRQFFRFKGGKSMRFRIGKHFVFLFLLLTNFEKKCNSSNEKKKKCETLFCNKKIRTGIINWRRILIFGIAFCVLVLLYFDLFEDVKQFFSKQK
jgi:hypothetical protein